MQAATAALHAGQEQVDHVGEAQQKAADAEKVLLDVQPRIPALREAAEAARKRLEAATPDASVAREKRKAELARQQTAILRENDALRARKVRLDLALDVQKTDALREQGRTMQEGLKLLDREIAAFEAVELWLQAKGARESLGKAGQLERDVANLVEEAKNLRARAAKEWPSAHSDLLPQAKRLDELRELRGRLDVAEAKLDVGLSVEVPPVGAVASIGYRGHLHATDRATGTT